MLTEYIYITKSTKSIIHQVLEQCGFKHWKFLKVFHSANFFRRDLKMSFEQQRKFFSRNKNRVVQGPAVRAICIMYVPDSCRITMRFYYLRHRT